MPPAGPSPVRFATAAPALPRVRGGTIYNVVMARLSILEYPDPRLRTRAAPVTGFDSALRQLVADLFETMYAAPGVGLAATQVDVHRRLLVADMSEGHDAPVVLINPEIIASSGHQIYQEGCLSFPGVFAEVERALDVRVRTHDVDGAVHERAFEGPLAVCIQHEMDHLDGKLFVDKLSPLRRTLLLKKLDKQRRHADSA